MNYSDEFNEIFKLFRRMLETGQIPGTSPQPHIDERNNIRTKRIGPIVYGRTTTVGPDGRVRTQEWSNLPPEAQKDFKASVPMRRIITVQDIANTVAFLASDISCNITGQTISIDGGATMV